MKILICGGGIDGLAAYLFLRKQLPASLPPGEPLEINILEKCLVDQKVANEKEATNRAGAKCSKHSRHWSCFLRFSQWYAGSPGSG